MLFRKPMLRRGVDRFNGWVVRLHGSPRWGRLVARHLTTVTYTGRRSGQVFSTPVGYRRQGDVVTIGVQFPDAKAWWRNFLGGGGAISLVLDGVERTGHAVSRRDERGRVTVTVRLDA